MVITGVLDSLERDEAEDFIRRHGGKVTGSVSGRTTYLLVGTDCGQSKYRRAKEHGTTLMDEDGLFAMVAECARKAGEASKVEEVPKARKEVAPCAPPPPRPPSPQLPLRRAPDRAVPLDPPRRRTPRRCG